MVYNIIAFSFICSQIIIFFDLIKSFKHLIQSAGKLENSFHLLLTNQLLWFDHSAMSIQSAGKLENSFHLLLTNQLLWFDHSTISIQSAGYEITFVPRQPISWFRFDTPTNRLGPCRASLVL
jgi:hypothetical protein